MKTIIIVGLSVCFPLSIYSAEMHINLKKKYSANPEVPPTPRPNRATNSNPQTPKALKVQTPKAETPKSSPKSSGKSSPLTRSGGDTPKTSVKSLEDLKKHVVNEDKK